MRKIFIVGLVSSLSLMACSQEKAPEVEAPAEAADTETKLLVIEEVAPVPTEPDALFTLSNAMFVTGIGGNFVTADVQYSGGCEDHEFKAYWDGSWMESNPPGAAIQLTHEANGDTCKELVTHALQINLEALGDGPEYWIKLYGAGNESEQVDVVIE